METTQQLIDDIQRRIIINKMNRLRTCWTQMSAVDKIITPCFVLGGTGGWLYGINSVAREPPFYNTPCNTGFRIFSCTFAGALAGITAPVTLPSYLLKGLEKFHKEKVRK